MKKFYLLCAVAMLSLSLSAAGHLKFKGVEIRGSVNAFVQEMEQQGLKFVSRNDNEVTLKGSFAGYKDCQILVVASEKSDSISQVIVKLPDEDLWNVLEEVYLDLQKRYSEKYGEPYTEEYNKNSAGTDFSKMVALKDGEASYRSVYSLHGGAVTVKIAYSNYPYAVKGHVEIIYNDTINETNRQKELNNDI
ncbi:MAG: hypothetical protein Q4D14_00525 [Bacteroidales bacterium]|nr:hypothetical protein [Bacteroidales bacterium]